jgi:hypothetical protein
LVNPKSLFEFFKLKSNRVAGYLRSENEISVLVVENERVGVANGMIRSVGSLSRFPRNCQKISAVRPIHAVILKASFDNLEAKVIEYIRCRLMGSLWDRQKLIPITD